MLCGILLVVVDAGQNDMKEEMKSVGGEKVEKKRRGKRWLSVTL